MKKKSFVTSIYLQVLLFVAGTYLCLLAVIDFEKYGVEGLFKISPRGGRFNITSFTGLLIGIVLIYFSGNSIFRNRKKKNKKH